MCKFQFVFLQKRWEPQHEFRKCALVRQFVVRHWKPVLEWLQESTQGKTCASRQCLRHCVTIICARRFFSPRVIIASILLWERFLVIKAVRVRSLWRSCLSNIGVVAATPYPRLREPVNRLADPSNDESTYPVVDWVNSSIQSISSQGKYHFTFSYHQIMNSNRAPKQWSLTKNETITTFEAWRQNLQYSLSLDANFAP